MYDALYSVAPDIVVTPKDLSCVFALRDYLKTIASLVLDTCNQQRSMINMSCILVDIQKGQI